MTPEQLARLFRPFSQGHASTTRKFGGTGLGLAICKRLVEMMHGEIGADSTPGVGSQFWFTLRVQMSVRDLPAAEPVRSPRPLRRMRASDYQILLVEDNTINQKVAQLMIRDLGYGVEVANNGVEAIKLFESQNYDLVLMDCLMPEMDGF